MRRIWAILVFVVVLMGAMDDASALLAGSYRCTGTLDNTTLFMAVVHYNPTANAQVIRRVRMHDSSGTLYFESQVPQTVAARGSFAFAVATPPLGLDDVQVLVSWTQATDTAAPIPKADVALVNASGDVSIARTACP